MAPRRTSHRALATALTFATAIGLPALVVGSSSLPALDPPPAITEFVLVDADTDTDIGTLNDDDTLDLSTLPDGLNVRAETDPSPLGPVQFTLDSVDVRLENNPVYALFGNSGSNYEAGSFAVGVHTLLATPVDGGDALSVTFEVIDGAPTPTPEPPTPTLEPPTPTDVPTPTNTPTPEPTATFTPTPTPTNTPTPVPPTPTNTPTPVPPTATATPNANALPVLVSKYAQFADTNAIQKVKYRPRSFNEGLVLPSSEGGCTLTNDGAFDGWDILPSLNEGSIRASTAATAVQVTTKRTSTVAVVWRGGTPLPSWLASGWTQNGTVVCGPTYPVYVKNGTMAAGNINLGGVNQGVSAGARNTYWVLLAESNGAPSLPLNPSILPNQPCASHPSGWHALIDPDSWCYYGHEHGVNPTYCPLPGGWAPDMGALSQLAGMTEGNPGFKVYVVQINATDTLCISHHFGTSSLARVCTRFHTMETILIRSGVVLWHYTHMQDFGAARDNSDAGGNGAPLTPNACPNQANNAPSSVGVRLVGVVSTGSVPYGPWRAGPNPILGIDESFIFNTPDDILICVDLNCNTGFVFVDNAGAKRFLVSNSYHVTDPGHGSTFCTDPMATAVISCSASNAVQQYVQAGLNYTLDLPGANCADKNGWHQPYTCTGEVGFSSERENSIPSGGPN